MISILDLGTSKISAALASNENNKLKVLESCTVKSEGFQKLERYKEHIIDAIVADLPKGQKSKTISEAIDQALK